MATGGGDTSFAHATFVWRNIGPARVGGYVSDIAVPLPQTPHDPRAGTIIYVGAPGGLFKTVDGGVRWKPLLDGEETTAVQSVAIAPSDPNIVWVGTGASGVVVFPQPGCGLLKSIDGGAHWLGAGFEKSEYIGTVKIHPTDPNTVWAGVLGTSATPSHERGLYKTSDGGKSWRQVLFVNEWTGVIDIAIDPITPTTLYAAAWQQSTSPRVYVDFGPGGGIYKSTDGGETWHKLGNGLPSGSWGRTGIAVSPASPNLVYAAVDPSGDARSSMFMTGKTAIYRSADYGEH